MAHIAFDGGGSLHTTITFESDHEVAQKVEEFTQALGDGQHGIWLHVDKPGSTAEDAPVRSVVFLPVTVAVEFGFDGPLPEQLAADDADDDTRGEGE